MKLSREKVERLVGVLPGAAAAYLVRDGLQRLCYTKGMPRLLGYSEEEYRELTLREPDASRLMLKEDRAVLLGQIAEACKSGEEGAYGYRIIKSDGSVIHVNFRACILGSMDGWPVLLCVTSEVSLDEMQLDMLNHVPVGMGIYKVEKGMPSLVYLNDSYYHMMGFTRQERASYVGENVIHAVHPDDQASVFKGIRTVLAGKVHHYRVVVRMLTLREDMPYHWVQMEGRVAKQDGATTYLYVSFTKIDNLKQVQDDLQKAKAELEKSQAWLQAAMDSAGVQYFEFFPAQKRAVSYQSKNRYGIPPILENCPDCLLESKIVHPEDMQRFREFCGKVNQTSSPAVWEGRLWVRGRYNWFRMVTTKVYDQGSRPVIPCSMTDINLQKDADEAYRNHLNSVLRMNPDAISSFRMNITQNVCHGGISTYKTILQLKDSGTVDGFVRDAQRRIPDAESRAQLAAAFNRKAILEAFEQGRRTISVEHRFRLEEKHTEWITTLADLMRNPVTGDVEGVFCTLNTNARRMARIVLQNTLQRSYDLIGVVDVETDEYFLFNMKHDTQGKHYSDFSQKHDAFVQKNLSAEEWQRLAPQLCIRTVKKMLAKQGSYSVNYFQTTPEGVRRKQVNYYYIDQTRRMLIASLRDFSDEDLLEQFRHASEHDPVTELYNRRKVFSECRHMLNQHPDEPFYLCHLDIQRFHLINSFYGETAGNALLMGIGQLLIKLSMNFSHAVYGRIESDVFCCCVSAQKETLERATVAIREWLKNYRSDFPVEANFGVYEIRDRKMSVEAMFARATLAAKRPGNVLGYYNGYYDDTMEAELQKEQQTSNDMHMALQQEQFKVYLQPKYILRSSLPCGAEALVRWEHPTKGIIFPGDFIPLFEQNGFILKLDRYMWEHVCALLRGWLDAGKKPYPISVNVSRVSMYSPTTVSFLHNLMEQYKLPHNMMQLELTESAYMDDPEEMKKRLCELQKDGFVILMDDFGSGYSSLNTLRELPVDYLKIDMRFLSAKEDNDRSRLILASVIRMACWLNLPVITEGVETLEQKEFLNGIGCTYAQGFLFARPMPVQKYEQEVLDRQGAAAKMPTEQLSTVASLVADSNETTQFLADHIPMPMAFVDVTEHDFAYMRANQQFQDVFGFGSDIIEKDILLEKHLQREDYQELLGTYCRASAMQASAECIFYWKNSEGSVRRYLMRASYLAKSAYSTILLATFLDITTYGRIGSGEVIGEQLLQNQYTVLALEQRLKILGGIFDAVRVVLPEKEQVLEADAQWNMHPVAGFCFECWGKSERCKDCISLQALQKNCTVCKVAQRGLERFFVFACPIEIAYQDGTLQKATMELILKPSEKALAAVAGDDPTNKKLVEYYCQLSYRDPLTAAWNRRYFNDMRYLEQDEYFKNDPSLGFILLDLYNFKAINDTLGHDIGDNILVEAATEIRHNIRPFDALIRYDGDEFLVVMPSCTEEQVHRCMDKLRTMLQHIHFGSDKKFTLQTSMGYSYTPQFCKGIEARRVLLHQADEQRMQDRKRNKNCNKSS